MVDAPSAPAAEAAPARAGGGAAAAPWSEELLPSSVVRPGALGSGAARPASVLSRLLTKSASVMDCHIGSEKPSRFAFPASGAGAQKGATVAMMMFMLMMVISVMITVMATTTTMMPLLMMMLMVCMQIMLMRVMNCSVDDDDDDDDFYCGI